MVRVLPTPLRFKLLFWRARVTTTLVLLTAPGVIFHEFAHKILCHYHRVPVEEVVYFQRKSPAGYVIHGAPRSWRQAASIALAPLALNYSIAAALFTIALVVLQGGVATIALAIVTIWLGVSAGVHGTPSNQDMNNLWAYTTSKLRYYPLVLLVAPVYAVVLLINKLGTYTVTVPLTATLLIVVGAMFQLSPVEIANCVFTTSWGCWESTIPGIDSATIPTSPERIAELLEN